MNEIEVIRSLAEEYSAHCESERNKNLRKIWSEHNSFKDKNPLILIGMATYNVAYPLSDLELVANDMFDDILVSKDEFNRNIERALRWKLYHISLNDDTIFEPYMLIPSIKTPDEVNRWGVPCGLGEHEKRGASHYNPVILEECDLENIKVQPHLIDKIATNKNVARYNDILGGRLNAISDDRPTLFRWTGDISTDFAKLLGLEELYYKLYDEPEMLKKLLVIMQKAILDAHDQWEKNGDCNSTCSFNQSMPYADGIADMSVKHSCERKDLFMFFSAQEFTTVSQEMWKEFCFDFQKPIMEKFGMIAYGCCEDLTTKLDTLLTLKNLRRVSVSPFANPMKCAEKIGDKFIISYRPSPANMVSRGINEDLIKKEIGYAKSCFDKNDCVFDIDLKDVQTVNNDPTVLPRFVEIARKIIEK